MNGKIKTGIGATAVIMLLSLMASLGGCEDRYRYPCQDPANWDSEDCKRPVCEVNRQCPDLIFKDNKKIELPNTPAPEVKKGDCK